MAQFGSVLLSFSVATSFLAVSAASWGLKKKSETILLFSRQMVYIHFLVVLAAMLVLLGLLYQSDFSVVYVTNHANRALPVFYRLTSLWAGQAGSMLLWNFLLVMFSAIAIAQIQRKQAVYVPYMIIILMGSSLFFSVLNNFSSDSDPFKVFLAGDKLVPQADGRGLNPLLQHWAMIIHPPILYFGYVSFAVPFAIAMAALMSKQLNLNWTRLIRRWTLFSWFFLGTGILLGGKWAYEELGWGGYWAWDPVENASLLPWLTGTAFLHSIIVQEKRGMFKVWNVILVSLSFFMCIFGTYLTRSGVVSSVHAFAKSDLGPYFLAFMAIIVIFSTYYIYTRYSLLKADRPINSIFSREVGFLLNNLLLMFSMIIVIVGTLSGTFTELVFDERVTYSPAWFNRVMTPIGLAILFLTGAGPLLAWRKTASRTLIKNFRLPLLIALLAFAAYLAFRWGSDELKILAGISFSLAAFVIVGISEEFIRAGLNRKSYTGEFFLTAIFLTLFQNKRRYLGYVVHLGLAIIFIGFTGKAFTSEAKITLRPGEVEAFGPYNIELASFKNESYPPGSGQTSVPLYMTQILTINVYEDNVLRGSDTTEVRTYPMFNPRTNRYDDTQTTSEPAILPAMYDDVYIQYGGTDKNGKMVLQIWINPLVSWVWLGFLIMVISGIVLLLPIGEKRTMKIGSFEFQVRPQSATQA